MFFSGLTSIKNTTKTFSESSLETNNFKSRVYFVYHMKNILEHAPKNDRIGVITAKVASADI